MHLIFIVKDEVSFVPFQRWGSLLDTFCSLLHYSSKYATLYEDLLPFCPLSIHAVLKAEEKGWE